MSRINLDTWRFFVARYGDYEARERLRWAVRKEKVSAKRSQRRDGLKVVWDLIHTWPRGTPMQNRKKFAEILRNVLQRIRGERERIDSYRIPGQPWQRLP